MSTWTETLKCPHCGAEQDPGWCEIDDAHEQAGWMYNECTTCDRSFRWTAELTPLFRTVTPEQAATTAQAIKAALEEEE